MRCAPWVGLLMMVLPWTPVGAAPAGAQVGARGVGGVVEDGRGVACGSAFDGERAPARDLYCIELLARPGIRGASGVVELSPLSSPFSAGVTQDGRLAYRPRFTLSGLPAPSTLGDFTTFVAWAADPTMYPIVKLGEVGNGTWSLEPIDLNKFVILISAERSADVPDREGRLVLRAQSASARMQPADVLDFLYGVGRRTPGDSVGMGAMASTGEQGGATGVRWFMPPMPEGLSMLPGVMELRSEVGPYLPSVPDPASLPEVRPREVLELGDGDTLHLEAGLVRRDINGRSFVMYAFNGQHPGPLLRVDQGTTVTVMFTNRIDWPTMVHWHGLRLDNRFDGTTATQDPVPPGGTFEYRVFFRDAGIYWYHPHVREDVTQDLGLYGNMRVVSSRPDFYSPAHREEIITLDDLLVGEQGLVPFGREQATHALMGRFGNVFLVNGEPDWEVEAQRGEVVRFFFTNVSNTRTYNLSFGGAPMKVVGSDVGNFEREEWVDNVVIAPAERYVVHVRFPEAGRFGLVNDVQGLDHLFGSFFSESDTLGSVVVSAEDVSDDLSSSFFTLREDGPTIEEIDRYRPEFERPVDYELELTMDGDSLPQVVVNLMQLDSTYFAPVEWSGTMPMMNWASSPDNVRWILRDPRSGRENGDIDWSFRVGEVVKIRLHNSRRVLHAMQHPIHIHGQRFLVLTVNGVPNRNLVWKDTLMLPVGVTADILLELSNPGLWMLHCHIAEHLEAGMMMVFTVQ
jgi:suppressor of ftsI